MLKPATAQQTPLEPRRRTRAKRDEPLQAGSARPRRLTKRAAYGILAVAAGVLWPGMVLGLAFLWPSSVAPVPYSSESAVVAPPPAAPPANKRKGAAPVAQDVFWQAPPPAHVKLKVVVPAAEGTGNPAARHSRKAPRR